MPDPQPIESTERTTPPPAAPVAAVSVRGAEQGVTAETKADCSLELSGQADKTPTSWLWLTKHDQTFVAVFVAVFVMLTGYH